MSNNFYCFGVCHICKIIGDLKTCMSCKTLRYCSKEHQALDWKHHKHLCAIMKETRNLLIGNNVKINNLEQFVQYRSTICETWKMKLRRPLERFEHQMWMFPFLCNVCYDDKNLIVCSDCYNVAYCSLKHKVQDLSRHSVYCKMLKHALNIEIFISKNDWLHYIDWSGGCEQFTNELPENLFSLVKLITKTNYSDDYCDEIRYILEAETLTSIASIAFALQKAISNKLIKSLEENFVIHVIGAANHEVASDWNLGTSILLHLKECRTIKRIKYVLVGPEVLKMDFTSLNLCVCCTNQNKIATIETHQELYHNIVNDLEKPNMIIALNCGFHEYKQLPEDTWSESLSHALKQQKVPLVFTSYTNSELREDIQRIPNINSDKNLQYISFKNPFASIRPVREWCNEDESIFYPNSFMCVIAKLL